jgi:hypothetical protein
MIPNVGLFCFIPLPIPATSYSIKKIPIIYVDLLAALELIDNCSPYSSLMLKLLIAQVGKFAAPL